MVKDLVCGMMVNTTSPPARSTYKGKEYFFCSTLCKIEFDKDPEKYIQQEKEQEKREGNND